MLARLSVAQLFGFYTGKKQDVTAAIEPVLIDAVWPASKLLANNNLKLACYAGAFDTVLLAEYVCGTIKEQGLGLKVAWI